jgi:hypothetical protein
MATTPDDVAKWMLSELQREKYLYQETVVYDIESKFGEDFIYNNDNGNPAIGKKVLSAFKKLTGDSVIWERGERLWRFRGEHDEPGRQQY